MEDLGQVHKDIEEIKINAAVTKAQIEWLGPQVERMNIKLDLILEKHNFLSGKVFGMCIVVSTVVGVIIEIARANF